MKNCSLRCCLSIKQKKKYNVLHKRYSLCFFIKHLYKKKNFRGFLSIFYNSCRTLVFGDLIGLNIKGLGLKFLKINKNYLVMNLGYADSVNFFIDCNRSIFFFKDIRNISIYSTDYCFLRNQIFTLVGLKKPNKFRKRENGITVSSQIV